MQIKKLCDQAIVPTRNNPTDAGLDLYALEDTFIPKSCRVNIPTGIAIAIPEGYVGLIFDRSSLGNKGLRTLAGVIDSHYRGEVIVILANVAGGDIITINAGDKVAQMVIIPVLLEDIELVEELDETDRGINGFGSSGV